MGCTTSKSPAPVPPLIDSLTHQATNVNGVFHACPSKTNASNAINGNSNQAAGNLQKDIQQQQLGNAMSQDHTLLERRMLSLILCMVLQLK